MNFDHSLFDLLFDLISYQIRVLNCQNHVHFIDISLEFGTAESLFVFCRIGAKYTKKRRFWTPWYDPYQVGTARSYQTLYGSYQVGTARSYQTWYGSYQVGTARP